MSGETCMIFIDDPDVWMEAQNLPASGDSYLPTLKNLDRGSRLKIDIGKLVEYLRKDRTQGPSFIYGSRPPPNDSVWETFKKNDFETNIYNRDLKGNSMSADMSEKATELRVKAEVGDLKAAEQRDNITFIVITGGRGMLPVVKKVVLRCKIRVELWAWKSDISNEYVKLDRDNSLFSVYLLDSIFKESFLYRPPFHANSQTWES